VGLRQPRSWFTRSTAGNGSPLRTMATAFCNCSESIASINSTGRLSSKHIAQVAADISLAVIHDRAKRSWTARRREVVNCCAAGENFPGGCPAPARSQSQSPNPQRVSGRPLAEPEALAPTSNRKRPTALKTSVSGSARLRAVARELDGYISTVHRFPTELQERQTESRELNQFPWQRLGLHCLVGERSSYVERFVLQIFGRW
jgi:hypothetical protein